MGRLATPAWVILIISSGCEAGRVYKSRYHRCVESSILTSQRKFNLLIQSIVQHAIQLLARLSRRHRNCPCHEKLDPHAALQKRTLHALARRGLDKCAEKLEADGVNARAEARRRDVFNLHRRHLTVRDTDAVLNKSHEVTDCNITPNTPESQLFNDDSTCVLNLEGETGPYYVPGEYIRTNVREGQPGVPVILDWQFIDVETCEPILNLWADIWNCNSTGVYSGTVAQGNGNSNDESNINATFLRELQKTDADGVVQFQTLFPGHYSERTTHHHVIAHLDATVLPNNTLADGTVPHIGQLFWDQDVIKEVEATAPYNTNDITLTTNAEDHVFSDETEGTTSDPVMSYVRLGDSLADGLFGRVTMAVNRSASYDPNYSFMYTFAGGVAESGGSETFPGGGAPSGSGVLPSGSPSGFPRFPVPRAVHD